MAKSLIDLTFSDQVSAARLQEIETDERERKCFICNCRLSTYNITRNTKRHYCFAHSGRGYALEENLRLQRTRQRDKVRHTKST